MDLHVGDRRALDRLRRLLHRTMEKDDRLNGKMLYPFDHGLRDLIVRLGHEYLQGMIALADVHEHHLGALRAGGVYAGTDEDLLTVHVGREIGDLRARLAIARGRLDERQLAVPIFGEIVVELGLLKHGRLESE